MLDASVRGLIAVLRDRRGISAMEYGILAAAIIGVVGTAAATIGSDLGTLLNSVINSLVNAGG
jgi:Flp pilus assembly pilin Flp